MMTQSPMISAPLKATNEIDWIAPLKGYIRDSYGDDPERYAEECATLNRLRQDMRGASKDSNSGRDVLYRYYAQLELLDLRFPVDEQHIKIPFTWFDAFTHKPTTQYSLAFEKASIIFNICAAFSCHAAAQSRADDAALKTAYHSLQASAGMFTYINENFLHAPSHDLSRETVKTLISVMLAQAQEVFLEKQIADGKKVALLAKLASQASSLYAQATEGAQALVNKSIFEKVWLFTIQALADDEAGQHGVALARLQIADKAIKDAERMSKGFPSSVPPASNLGADSGTILQELCQRQVATVKKKLVEASKDNDFVYHQTVPPEASLPAVAKLPAAKPMPLNELYAGFDITSITGPDLFNRLVPMAVTESASLYDEEKAKLIRAETEKVDTANGEMAASLDYLRLPATLQVLRGGYDDEIPPDADFEQWCVDVADHEEPARILDWLKSERDNILSMLERSSKQLDMEESVCEKMRSKYEGEWNQQPSARLTTTLRGDIASYREALEEAARSDLELETKLRQNECEFNEMRQAVLDGQVNKLFQKTVSEIRAREGGNSWAEPSLIDARVDDDDDDDNGEPSIRDQVSRVAEYLKKLNQVQKERNQVLKDLKDKVHNDDIYQVLMLNKKSLPNYESQLFEQELDKFRPHQDRLLQANHKQTVLMKELTTTFDALLQDPRVRSKQSKYEAIQRQRSAATKKYKRAYEEFLDLEAGLQSAKNWYGEMRETTGSLEKNVESFVNNRRSEGGQLLNQIEQSRAATTTRATTRSSSQAELEQERLRELMDRMSVGPLLAGQGNGGSSGGGGGFHAQGPPAVSPPPSQQQSQHHQQRQHQQQHQQQHQHQHHPQLHQNQNQNQNQQHQHQQQHLHQQPHQPLHQNFQQPTYSGYPGAAATTRTYSQPTYDPSQYGPRPSQASSTPASHQTTSFGLRGPASPPPVGHVFSSPGQGSYVPPGYVPPPPPPGPPPLGPQQTIHYDYSASSPPAVQQAAQQTHHDPWAGLSTWK